MTRVRWWMLGLLFFSTTICYLDRIVFSFLAPVIRKEVHLTDETYGYVTGAFQIAYMVGFLFSGKWIDRVGTRLGYAVAIT
jgi:ACS family hexuronate transporter-like MFS transporter